MKKCLLFGFLIFTFWNSYGQCTNDLTFNYTVSSSTPDLSIYHVAKDAADNVYMLVGYPDTVTLHGQTFFKSPGPGYGLVAVKYDADMNFVWANNVSGDGFFAYLPALTVRDDGSIVIAVNEIDAINGQTFRVEAFSNADPWETLWTQEWDPNGSGVNLFDNLGAEILPNRVVSDPAGNVYVTGDFSGNITFNATTLTAAPGVGESFLLKLDASGNVQWATQSTGSAAIPETFNLKYSSANNSVIVAGSYVGEKTFAGFTFPTAGWDYGYVFSVDAATGNGNWATTIQGESGSYNVVYGLDVDAQGNSYVTGFAKGPTVNLAKYSSYGTGSQTFIGSFSPTGATRWFTNAGGYSSANSFGTVASLGNGNDLFVNASLRGDPWFYNGNVLGVPAINSTGAILKIDRTNGQLIWISPNEAQRYAGIVTSNGNFIQGIVGPNGGATKLSLTDRPKPTAKVLTPNGTLLNPTVTFQAYNNTGYTFQWYQAPSTLLAGQTGVTYNVGGAGNYYVQVSNGTCTVNSLSVRAEGAATLASDSIALRELFNATGGASWFRRENWTTGPVSTWEGVVINGGRVTDLFLDQNNLTGNLPPSFWNLTSLQQFRMWGNPSLSVTLSSAIGNLQNLRVFDFGNAYVSGTLPVELANLPQLEEVQLYDSKNITGTIPTEFGTRTTLRMFNVSQAKLSGTFPAAIWQLPSLELIDVGGNTSLAVTLPANLNTRTQFKTISIWATIPIRGAFPTGFTSLINLERLELGGMRFTGQLPTALGNLTKLRVLNLVYNRLDGAFPSSIANITTLEQVYLRDNRFTSFPDFNNSPSLSILSIFGNPIDFNSVIPNLDNGIATFNYAPFGRRDDVWTKVAPGSTYNFANSYNTAGNIYQWIANNDTIPGANSQNYSITNIQTSKLGGYVCRISNPAVPGRVITTNFWNLAMTGAARSWTVDNSPGSVADFKDLYPAIYGTDDGDTLYVNGSTIPYGTSSMILNSPRVIIGPGYFLSENGGNQAGPQSANVANLISINSTASGSVISGLEFSKGTISSSFYINNSNILDGDTARNITISKNKFNNTVILTVGHINGLNFSSNFGGDFQFYGGLVDSQNNQSAVYRNFTVNNNLNLGIGSWFQNNPATAQRNVMQNMVVKNNVLKGVGAWAAHVGTVSGLILTDNVIAINNATGNTESNNLVTDYTGGGIFENASGTFSVDTDFKPAAGSPLLAAGSDGTDIGATGGITPYTPAGLPAVPSIYEVNDLGRLRFGIKAKSNQTARPNLVAIEYIVSQNGAIIDQGSIRKFTPYDSLNFGFRPRLTNVTPNGNYDLLYRVLDQNGKYSVYSKTGFIATVTTVTGSVITSNDQPVNPGEFLLFEVNLEGTGFDTLKTNVTNGSFSLPNVVIGDYLAAAYGNPTTYPDELPSYFNNTVFWEEADTLAIDETNNTVALKLVARPTLPTGEGVISGAFFEDDDASGRIYARTPIASAGVSVRRERGVSSGRPTAEYDLIAYVQTDEDGNFTLPQLNVGEYLLNFQYPGYPMDETSFIKITIGTTQADKEIQVEAQVIGGLIVVRKIEITSIQEDQDYVVDVFPNPTSTFIEVKGDDETAHPSIYLLDTMGRTLKLKSGKLTDGIQLDVTDLETGVYLLKVFLPEKGVIKTSRVVIK